MYGYQMPSPESAGPCKPPIKERLKRAEQELHELSNARAALHVLNDQRTCFHALFLEIPNFGASFLAAVGHVVVHIRRCEQEIAQLKKEAEASE